MLSRSGVSGLIGNNLDQQKFGERNGNGIAAAKVHRRDFLAIGVRADDTTFPTAPLPSGWFSRPSNASCTYAPAVMSPAVFSQRFPWARSCPSTESAAAVWLEYHGGVSVVSAGTLCFLQATKNVMAARTITAGMMNLFMGLSFVADLNRDFAFGFWPTTGVGLFRNFLAARQVCNAFLNLFSNLIPEVPSCSHLIVWYCSRSCEKNFTSRRILI
jgi:hypothetical protein